MNPEKLIPKEEEVLSLNFQSEGNLRRVTQQTSKESKNKCNVFNSKFKVKVSSQNLRMTKLPKI